MFKYHCPIEEAMIFIANVVNDATVAKLALELVDNHKNYEQTHFERACQDLIEGGKHQVVYRGSHEVCFPTVFKEGYKR